MTRVRIPAGAQDSKGFPQVLRGFPKGISAGLRESFTISDLDPARTTQSLFPALFCRATP
jgi:hypothetical protein